MRKVLIIALGLIAVGALAGVQPADARQVVPANKEQLPPKKPVASWFGQVFSGSTIVLPPRQHPQLTDPVYHSPASHSAGSNTGRSGEVSDPHTLLHDRVCVKNSSGSFVCH